MQPACKTPSPLGLLRRECLRRLPNQTGRLEHKGKMLQGMGVCCPSVKLVPNLPGGEQDDGQVDQVKGQSPQ